MITKEALETAINAANTWSTRATLVLAIGILGEYVVLPFLGKERWYTRPAQILFAILVVSGIAGEYEFASQIAQKSSALQRLSDADLARAISEAGDANERASTNEKEAAVLRKQAADEQLARVALQSKVAWRRLDSKTRSEVASHLSIFARQPTLITYSESDIEASTFASDIAAVLHAAKWEVAEPLAVLTMPEGPVPFGTNRPLLTGVEIGSTGDQTSRKAALSLIEELSRRGFDAKVLMDPRSLLAIHPMPTRVVIDVEHKPEGAQGEYKLRQKVR